MLEAETDVVSVARRGALFERHFAIDDSRIDVIGVFSTRRCRQAAEAVRRSVVSVLLRLVVTE